ncbi:MAG: nascent polypeptide-associated complex protein [Candidatus Bathyarchaeia archaeon]
MAYKAMRAARGAHGSRDASRMMQKMGVKMDELQDVSQVIIKTPSKDIVIGAPSVTLVTVQGQVMYQIVGGEVSEMQPQAEVSGQAAVSGPPEADVLLVVQQTGKTSEEARKALVNSDGDLARAILLLKG